MKSWIIAAAMATSPVCGVALAQSFAPVAAPEMTVAQAKADPANWRAVDPENMIVFETSAGRVVIEMLPDVAPAHAAQFRALVRSGDYAGTSFHRVIDDFMAQGGDIFALKGRDSGLPDIPGEFTFRRDPSVMVFDTIGPEDTAQSGWYLGFPMQTQAMWLAEMSKDGLVESWIPHCPSVVSTARTDNPNSANSQFFLMRGRAEHLDKQYTAWGRVIEGQQAVLAIATGEPPIRPDTLLDAQMAADMAEGERPVALVQRTDGPLFAQVREDAAASEPADVCELPPVPAVVEG